MSNGTTNENKAELEEELKDEDRQAGDDQNSNSRRDKFTTLHGAGEGESADSTTSTTSTPSTTGTTQ